MPPIIEIKTFLYKQNVTCVATKLFLNLARVPQPKKLGNNCQGLTRCQGENQALVNVTLIVRTSSKIVFYPLLVYNYNFCLVYEICPRSVRQIYKSAGLWRPFNENILIEIFLNLTDIFIALQIVIGKSIKL